MNGLGTVFLLAICGLASFFDLKFRIIPNWVTLGGILLGLGIHYLKLGMPGFFLSLGSAGFGFIVLFPFFYVGGIGGGDVKFLAALGALFSWPHIVFAACYGGILGGLFAVILVIWKGRILSSTKLIFRTFWTFILPHYKFVPIRPEETIPFPYGIALAGGALCRVGEMWFSR